MATSTWATNPARAASMDAPAVRHWEQVEMQVGGMRFASSPILFCDFLPPQQTMKWSSSPTAHECSHPVVTEIMNFDAETGTSVCPAKLAPQHTTLAPSFPPAPVAPFGVFPSGRKMPQECVEAQDTLRNLPPTVMGEESSSRSSVWLHAWPYELFPQQTTSPAKPSEGESLRTAHENRPPRP
eukprot:CAMPEP_0180118134 /NCGR_PEP_ID=MMETSP0986-20121125/1296_1 /TAXON_ID=697907 /ORGANISM="non described non described, Strain CCMP2293" /LENGTH=182 /DNA_ID=CAMNT_0022057067 /DNA_START=89 /DNA_END=637 /DNA_ORIENTATION=+